MADDIDLEKFHLTASWRLVSTANPFDRINLDRLTLTGSYRLLDALNPFDKALLDRVHLTAAYRGPTVGFAEASGDGRASADAEVVLAIRPFADSAVGGWKNESNGSVLYASISKPATDDATYIVSALDTPNDTARVKLGVPDYELGDEVEVEYRIGKYPPLATQALDITVRLLQGTAEIAAWTHPDVAGPPASVIRPLTGPQVAAISDFSDLYLEFVSNPQ